MTGFGKSQAELPGKLVTVEIKSLNSKQLDLNVRLPNLFRDREAELRSMVSQSLERGKVDINIIIENKSEEATHTLNKEVLLDYYRQLKSIAKDIPGEESTELLPILVRMPEVLRAEKEEADEQEWKLISNAIAEAIGLAESFRTAEGQTLEKDVRQRINQILNLLEEVEPFEGERIKNLKKRILTQLNELLNNGEYDENRFEQEMIYYLEKLDITEEKVRLKKHCEYFLETLEDTHSSGKKLGFISQEIGREINTLGSKANDVNIQKIVILMKDELEKVKEQLNNIL
jgi:uncharacterized protein (TIGR00255 family)